MYIKPQKGNWVDAAPPTVVSQGGVKIIKPMNISKTIKPQTANQYGGARRQNQQLLTETVIDDFEITGDLQ